jgi:hypothetical protein
VPVDCFDFQLDAEQSIDLPDGDLQDCFVVAG